MAVVNESLLPYFCNSVLIHGIINNGKYIKGNPPLFHSHVQICMKFSRDRENELNLQLLVLIIMHYGNEKITTRVKNHSRTPHVSVFFLPLTELQDEINLGNFLKERSWQAEIAGLAN